MDFIEKIAVITGAASGIGRSIALAMADLGTDIVVADIDDARINDVCRDIRSKGRRALGVHCDISLDADVKNLVDRTNSEMGAVDILVNNAGVVIQGLPEKLKVSDWEWIFGINVFGTIRTTTAFMPGMMERGSGYIVNTASITGLMTSYGPPVVYLKNTSYSTSKFALVGYSEALYIYLKPKGITVSVLCPGAVITNIRDHARYVGDDRGETEALIEEGVEAFSQPDVLKPEDVAGVLINAMKEKRFFVLTHPGTKTSLREQGRDIDKQEKYLQENFR